MTELEDVWRRKSDEQLQEAFLFLSEYSEEGQRVIRAEFDRRNLEAPAKPVISINEAEALAGLYRRFVGLVAAQWLSVAFILFGAPYWPRAVGSVVALLCRLVLLCAVVAVPITGKGLLTRLEADSPGGTAVLMYMPIVSLLALFGLGSYTQRWSKRYGIDVGFLGPTRESLARLRDA